MQYSPNNPNSNPKDPRNHLFKIEKWPRDLQITKLTRPIKFYSRNLNILLGMSN